MNVNTFNNDRPIRWFMIVLFASVAIGVLMCVATIDHEYPYFNAFTLSMIIWHAITAIGIMTKYKWGFYLFKFYLCVLYIGFPIGTYVAKKYLEYIKEHAIESYYR